MIEDYKAVLSAYFLTGTSVGFIASEVTPMITIQDSLIGHPAFIPGLARMVRESQVTVFGEDAPQYVLAAGFFWVDVPEEARLLPDADVILHIEWKRSVSTLTRAAAAKTWIDVTPKLRSPYPPFLYTANKGDA